mgnify:CR=1 FL=1
MTKAVLNTLSDSKALKAHRGAKKVEEHPAVEPSSTPPPATLHTAGGASVFISPEARAKSQELLATPAAAKPVLVFLPGSSGRVSADHKLLLAHLRETFDVHTLEKGETWGGWAVAKVSSERNTKAAADLIHRVTGQTQRWFLMAASFGNRVAAELLSPPSAHLLPGRLPAAVVCVGIPLYAASKSRDANERTSHFARSFPAGLRVLLVSGTNDSCLKSKAPEGGPKGEALLQAQAARWACGELTQVYMVPGGGHGALDGSAKPPAVHAAEEAMRAFMLQQ